MNGFQYLLPAKMQRHASGGSFGKLPSVFRRSLGGKLHVAAENGGGELVPRAGERQFSAIGTRLRIRVGRFRVGGRAAMKLAPHIALGKNAVHRVVITQEERRAVGP